MRCRTSGSFGAHEIPLLVMLFYLFRDAASSRPHGRLVLDLRCVCAASCAGDNSQVGSLAGAAHLLNNDTGVLSDLGKRRAVSDLGKRPEFNRVVANDLN